MEKEEIIKRLKEAIKESNDYNTSENRMKSQFCDLHRYNILANAIGLVLEEQNNKISVVGG